MEIEKELIVTGQESKVSKKTGEIYYLLTVLFENGKTADLMYKGDPKKLTLIEAMQKYIMRFKLELGKYTRFTVEDIVIN